MSQAEITKNMQDLLVEIVQRVAGSSFLLFALDDAHNVDADSWSFVSKMAKASRSLCVLAMRPFGPEKPICDAAKQVYVSKTC